MPSILSVCSVPDTVYSRTSPEWYIVSCWIPSILSVCPVPWYWVFKDGTLYPAEYPQSLVCVLSHDTGYSRTSWDGTLYPAEYLKSLVCVLSHDTGYSRTLWDFLLSPIEYPLSYDTSIQGQFYWTPSFLFLPLDTSYHNWILTVVLT